MPDLVTRLEQFMDKQGINNNQLTVKAGLSVGLIGTARKKRTGLHSDNIAKILTAYPELNSEWLLTGAGEMLKKNVTYSEGQASVNIHEPENEYVKIIRELSDTIEVLKNQLTEANKDKEFLRKLISEEKK